MQHRQPVRLGKHGTDYIFERAVGLHEPETGIAVVGVDAHDPEVLFEEHGLGITCQYLELLGDDSELNEDLGPDRARDDIAERVASENWATKFHVLQGAFALERPDNVNVMLRNMKQQLAPEGGGVFLIRTSPRLQRRKAMIRVQHAAQAQPDREIDELLEEPQPLEQHSAGHDGLHHYLYSPLVLIASPFVRGFTSSRVIREATETYTLVVMHPPGRSTPSDGDEVTWETVFHNGLPPLHDLHCVGVPWVRTLNAPAAGLPARPLLEWWTEQLNVLLTEVTDLGRYRDGDGLLDARNAYRELRTLDRIISNCVRIQVNAEDHVGRVGLAFEFFDLLPNLLPTPIEPTRMWRSLAAPNAAVRIFERAFSSAPEPIGSVLLDRGREIAKTLQEETLQTVVPGRSHGEGVLVGNRTAPIQSDHYIPKLLHQLRNTHHGYELHGTSQREILDTHTGHITVAFPELVVLYVLALVADPSGALNGSWLSNGTDPS